MEEGDWGGYLIVLQWRDLRAMIELERLVLGSRIILDDLERIYRVL